MTDPCKDCKVHAGVEVMLDAICKKLDEKEKITNIKFDALYDSIKLARDEMNRRLEGMNEFREQLRHQAATFISKNEVELLLGKIEAKYNPLFNLMSERKGARRWEDHIIEVLIGIAVIFIVWMIKK